MTAKSSSTTFDLLELNGADLRPLGLEERKAKLAALIERLTRGSR